MLLIKTFFIINKTPLGENGCLSNLPFPNTVSQDRFGTLKKYIFKIALSKNRFLKNIFSKLLPQKCIFENCASKTVFSKNINFIASSYSSSKSSESSESSEKLSK